MGQAGSGRYSCLWGRADKDVQVNMYESTVIIANYGKWLLLLAAGLMVLRIIHTGIAEMGNSDPAAFFKKVKNNIIATVVCVVIASFVELVQKYYQ